MIEPPKTVPAENMCNYQLIVTVSRQRLADHLIVQNIRELTVPKFFFIDWINWKWVLMPESMNPRMCGSKEKKQKNNESKNVARKRNEVKINKRLESDEKLWIQCMLINPAAIASKSMIWPGLSPLREAALNKQLDGTMLALCPIS